MDAIKVIQLINLALDLAADAHINIQKLQALRAQADAEQRQITSDELRALADDAQDAIDRL
ncbi:MAG: hypothetical protein CMQ46_05700 [Gammaproteobacteria bacterium]|nr:hypothetical protein [Gammaproteobacteria bacterium]MBJ54739.1 hypothetical protein [Gammaproteobacteria bacterium]|tara:strand:- start:408 stop:590 length:183 start_codon:yes stop_codon:yes gene_type:complete